MGHNLGARGIRTRCLLLTAADQKAESSAPPQILTLLTYYFRVSISRPNSRLALFGEETRKTASCLLFLALLLPDLFNLFFELLLGVLAFLGQLCEGLAHEVRSLLL